MSAPTDAQRLTRMGYHLLCDVKHDFTTKFPIYNIGGEGVAAKVGKEAHVSEEGALAFFLKGEGSSSISDLAARNAGEIIFTVPDTTASFQNWKPPLLFDGGNSNIGIIQDAGEFITERIKAKNVITFGSILDPAGKPIRPDQKPIWFQPTPNTVEIPLASFGFDPAKIKSIIVKDLTAGTVKAEYRLGNNVLIDAVKMMPSDPKIPSKAKPINNTDVDKAGFFTSINKVENIDRELVTTGVFKKTGEATQFVGANLPYFYIGKTLGDAMLVASAMKSFPWNATTEAPNNPYYGIGGTTWKTWGAPNAPTTPPSVLALKTGDRLNWLRAIIMNVPAIYEDQAKGGRAVKQYRFFPGLADPDAVITAILKDFDKISEMVRDRYLEVQKSLLSMIMAGTTNINPGMTNFAPGGGKVINTTKPVVISFAGNLIVSIANSLIQVDAANNVTGGIARFVVSWVQSRSVVAKQNYEAAKSQNTVSAFATKLRAFYSETLERANACSPQAGTMFIAKGKEERYLTSKLVVATVPPSSIGWPLPKSIDIALRNAFAKINGIRDEKDATLDILKGTDIANRFLSALPPPPPPPPAPPSPPSGAWEGRLRQKGGADAPLDLTSLAETVTEVVGTPPPPEGPIAVQQGGAYLSIAFAPEIETAIPLFPRVADFVGYMRTRGVTDPQHLFLSVYDVARRRNTDRVVDPILALDLTRNLGEMMGVYGGTPYVQIPNANRAVFENVDYVYSDVRYPSSVPTLLFNAYTNYVNARAAAALSGEQSQSVTDYTAIEQLYLSQLPKWGANARIRFEAFEEVPRKKIVSSKMAQEGGLRTRRPLYSNHHGTSRSSSSLDSDDDERKHARLRKRARARATPRVRKHTGNPKTRRQRKPLDRV